MARKGKKAEKNEISIGLNFQEMNLNSKQSQSREIFEQFGPSFQINLYFCDGCGLCAEVCPVDAIIIQDYRAIVPSENFNLCYVCGSCMSVCMKDAIFRD